MKSENIVNNMDVKNPFGTTTFSNRFLIHEEDSFPLLQAIYRGKAPFTSDAYSMLANTMERFYKGILLELQLMYPDKVVVPNDLNSTHRFTHIIAQVNKHLPISNSKEGVKRIVANCDRIGEGYTRSRYHEMYEKPDFDKDFQRFSSQRERLFILLDAERIKFNAKEIMAMHLNVDEKENDEDDFEYWR